MTNFISVPGSNTGNLAYCDETSWLPLIDGVDDQVLTMETGTPTWKTPAVGVSTYKIGDLHLGGIIFYVNPHGLHGLIADLDNTSLGVVYSSANTLTGASFS